MEAQHLNIESPAAKEGGPRNLTSYIFPDTKLRVPRVSGRKSLVTSSRPGCFVLKSNEETGKANVSPSLENCKIVRIGRM